jgi:hypothetical protein
MLNLNLEDDDDDVENEFIISGFNLVILGIWLVIN